MQQSPCGNQVPLYNNKRNIAKYIDCSLTDEAKMRIQALEYIRNNCVIQSTVSKCKYLTYYDKGILKCDKFTVKELSSLKYEQIMAR